MNLQELLGERYVEGMSLDDINGVLSTMKIADLSTGNYVDKNKYNAEISKLQTSLNDKTAQLQSKLTDDEKKQNETLAKDTRIQELEALIEQQKIENNKNKSIATLSESKTLLELKDDDKDFNGFVDNIAKQSSEDANSISSYFNKLIKDAYNKGKNDAVKDKLGNMGKAKGSSSGKAEESIGSKLGKLNTNSVKNSYFGKMNK